MSAALRYAALALVIACVSGCFTIRYVGQAAVGQGDLMKRARPISEVIDDPTTSPRTRRLLMEVAHVRSWARSRGMKLNHNYQKYVALERSAVVWVVTAAERLSLQPYTWDFPIVGSFPMLGWFDLKDALEFRKEMERKGYDAYLRGAGAFSTAGWFNDPILSTMFGDSDAALGDLVNVILHESVHATILVKHQQYFNESLAQFMGDHMTSLYLVQRYGEDSQPVTAYRAALEVERVRVERTLASYNALEKLYASSRTTTEKLREKKRIFDALERDLSLSRRPNNAMIMGVRLYRAGYEAFRRLFETCGQDWKRFRRAVSAVRPSWFSKRQADDLDPVIAKAGRLCRKKDNRRKGKKVGGR